jgi:hypothetical protein
MRNIIKLSRNEISAVSGGVSTSGVQEVCKFVLQIAILYLLNGPSKELLANKQINHVAMRVRHTIVMVSAYNIGALVGAYLFS